MSVSLTISYMKLIKRSSSIAILDPVDVGISYPKNFVNVTTLLIRMHGVVMNSRSNKEVG